MQDAKLITLETRPYIDLPTSLLLNIKSNLNFLLKAPIDNTEPVLHEIMRNTWKAELKGIESELIQRN
jgi:hypothetical protein